MIYFLQRADGAIKIGTSKNPINRIRLHVVTHHIVDVMGVMDGDRIVEIELHKRFNHLKHPQNSHALNEWFISSDEILKFITQNAQPDQSLSQFVEGFNRSKESLTNKQKYRAWRAGHAGWWLDDIDFKAVGHLYALPKHLTNN